LSLESNEKTSLAARAGAEREVASTLRDSGSLEAVVADISAGHAPAFDDFYHKTVGFVFAIARNVLRTREDAEEVVCDVFVAVWKNAPQYDRARGSVLAWLATMTRNRSIDKLRTRRLRDDVDAVDEWSSAPAPEDTLHLFESGTAVHRALAELAPVCRLLIGMAFFQGMSHQEMATRLSMPLGTVKSKIRRSLGLLKTRIAM